ncbi:MAG: hypothetical protein N3B01_04875 [Verrucomicrobiae bacterium]|nr:hypothetical protein [Verrucomicrobiae bacterium]
MKTAAVICIALLSLQRTASCGQTQSSTVNPFWRGTVLRIEPKSGELVLKTPDGERTCYLTPRTHIFRGEEKLTADKLKPGDHLKLRVTGSPTGAVTVIRIKVDTNTVPLPPLTLP